MVNSAADVKEFVGQIVQSLTNALVELSAKPPDDDLLALIFLGFLVACAWFELRHPFLRPGLRTVKNSYLTNICTFIFNDISLSLMSIPSLYYVAQMLGGKGLLSPLDDGFGKYLLAFILLDFSLYAWHYATHHFDSLWIFHKVHHSDRTLNVTTGLRFHMGELFMEVLVRVAFIGIMGVDPDMVLVMQTVITLFVLFHHTNITFRGERLLSMIFIVPHLHRVHHSAFREEHDSNYGAVFSIWDRLFGTLREQEPKAIGLNGVDEQQFVDLFKYGFTTRIHFKRARGLVEARERA